MHKYFKMAGNKISSWESKGLFNEKLSSITTSSFNFSPTSVYHNARIKLKFDGDFFKQDENATSNHGPIINIYIVYELSTFITTSNITLENYLFGAVEATGNLDIDKYKYSGYGIRFDSRGSFSHPSGGFGKNVIIFGADSSVHANNKTRNILVPGKVFIQGIGNTTIYAEKMYSINFTKANRKLCLSLHYNGDDSYLFINDKEIIKFKAKDSKVVPYPLCLGNVSKDFSPSNMHKTELSRYVYDFSDDYNAIKTDDILDIHKYLMEKNNVKLCLDLSKHVFLQQWLFQCIECRFFRMCLNE